MEYNEQQEMEFDIADNKPESPFADSPYEILHEVVNVEPVKKKQSKHISKKILKCILSLALIVALIAGTAGVTAFVLNQQWQKKMDLFSLAMSNKFAVLQEELNSKNNGNSNGSAVVVPDGLLTPAQVYEKNVDAVVAVTTDKSMGSGFVITADGYIVSNQHVVDGAKKITVTLNNGKEYSAKLVGQDESNDVSLLKIEEENLVCVTIGNSSKLSVGDQVAAIGNPLGELTATLTVGYVSGKDRVVATDGTSINMLQTDAAINSGNSGGPLLDMNGMVVGITTAKYSGTSNSGASIEGISFAIPIDDVVEVVADLLAYGYVKSAYLGVYVRDVDATVVQYYGFPEGAYVDETMPGLAAESAGILARDIIVNVGGYDVTSVDELTRVLRKFEPGQETTITVYRNGSRVDLMVTFGEMPHDNVEQDDDSQQSPSTPSYDEFDDWWDQFPFF